MRPLHGVGMLCTAGAILLVTLAAQACDTPVYEYTIRYWDRDAYLVLHFHRGSEAMGDATVNERLTKMPRSDANIWFQSVDVDSFTDETAKSLAQHVWQQHAEDELPLYVVLSPRRAEVYSGPLDLASIEAIAKSPKRTEMNKQLCDGKQGVLVLLKGPLADENTTAEKVVRATLATAVQEDHQVGLVVMKRDDPKEQWFVRQLLALEPDLKDLDNAMVFAVFGRGHALEPYLGKGITERNLAEVIWFMNGPCSCEIKMTAPGVDLITDWNWQAHVAQMPFLEEAPVEFQIFDVEEAPTEIAIETVDPQPAVDEPEGSDQRPGERGVEPTEAVGQPEPPEAEAEAVAESAPQELRDQPEPAASDLEATPEPAPEAEAVVEDEEAPPADVDDEPVQIALAEAERGPLTRPVPDPATAAATLEPEEPETLTASMGPRLGLLLGGLGVLVVVVGAVLVRSRKES